jgi:hypothetical protein
MQLYAMQQNRICLQERVDALQSQLQSQLTQHQDDVQREEAASKLRGRALSELAQLTENLSNAVETQAHSLEHTIAESSDLLALLVRPDAVAEVQSEIRRALKLDDRQAPTVDGGPDEHEFSTSILLLSTVHDGTIKLLATYHDLWRASLELAERHSNLSQEQKVCVCTVTKCQKHTLKTLGLSVLAFYCPATQGKGATARMHADGARVTGRGPQ